MIDSQFYNSGELSRGVFDPFYGKYRKTDVRSKIFDGTETPTDLSDVYIEFSIYDKEKTLQHWNRFDDYETDSGDFSLDIETRIEEAGIPDGANYILRFNFFEPKIENVYVKGIDGQEIRVRPDPGSSISETFNSVFGSAPDPLQYIANFGSNKYFHVLDWSGVPKRDSGGDILFDANGNPVSEEAVIRLEKEIPDSVSVGDNVWIDRQISRPYFDRFQIFRSESQPSRKELAGPDFSVEFNNGSEKNGNYENLNELASNQTTSEQLIKDRIKTNEEVELNIDFSDFENFVKYSSAEERIKNFRYKIRTINRNVEKLKDASAYASRIRKKIESIIGSFDAYEQWLFRNKYPKNEANALKNPDEAEGWFKDQISKGKSYDSQNDSALRKQIPEFVRQDPENEDFVLFVDLIGHWFDVNWIYIKHLNHINRPKENAFEPKTLSPDLSRLVVESFGFETYNGFNAEKIFDEIFDTENIERLFVDKSITPSSPQQIKNNKVDLTRYQAQQQIWRRMLNNVISFYKNKGNPSSVKEIANVLGIPSESLVIRESGQTSIHPKSKVKLIEDSYFGSFFSSQFIKVPWQMRSKTTNGESKYVKSMEIRFRTEFQGGRSLRLVEIDQILEISLVNTELGENKGKLQMKTINPDGSKEKVSTKVLPIYNGEWTNVIFRLDEEKLFLNANIQQRSPFGNKKFEDQISLSAKEQTVRNIARTSGAYVGGKVDQTFFTNSIPFAGDIDQINAWSHHLSEEQFRNHVFAPVTYDGTSSDSTNIELKNGFQKTSSELPANRQNLMFRVDFERGKIENLSSTLQPKTINEIDVEKYKRENYLRPVQIGNISFLNNKIKVIEEKETRTLYPDKSSKSINRKNISDENDSLKIYFSPYSYSNRDVTFEVGISSINKLLGNPLDQRRNRYHGLDRLNKDYWKKYDENVDIQSYIRYIDNYYDSLFDHIKKMIPAQSSPSTGILIEPSITERDRHQRPTGSIKFN